MKRRWAIVGMVVTALLGAAAGGGIVEAMQRHETPVTMDQVPAAVKATLQSEAQGGNISEIEREACRGRAKYEARATIGKDEYKMKVAENGTLLMKMLKHGKRR